MEEETGTQLGVAAWGLELSPSGPLNMMCGKHIVDVGCSEGLGILG